MTNDLINVLDKILVTEASDIYCLGISMLKWSPAKLPLYIPYALSPMQQTIIYTRDEVMHTKTIANPNS